MPRHGVRYVYSGIEHQYDLQHQQQQKTTRQPTIGPFSQPANQRQGEDDDSVNNSKADHQDDQPTSQTTKNPNHLASRKTSDAAPQ